MFDTFRARAQAVSAEVHRVPSRREAVDLIVALLRTEKVADAPGAWAVWAPGTIRDGLDRDALARELPGLRFEVSKELAAGARVGVSEFDYGVANTGTVAQRADAVEQRLASTLPTIHVALLPASRIVGDLGALFARLSPADSRYLALVTGPSRTADIERVLTIGVHGPERLVIVVVDDLAGSN
jgi:L-lactate dehydrogenase complex protein LldG